MKNRSKDRLFIWRDIVDAIATIIQGKNRHIAVFN